MIILIIASKPIDTIGIFDSDKTFDGLCYYYGEYTIMSYISELLSETETY